MAGSPTALRRRRNKADADESAPPLDFRLIAPALAMWTGCLIALLAGPNPAFITALLAAVAAIAVLLRAQQRWRLGLAVALFCLAGGSAMCAARTVAAMQSPIFAAATQSNYADAVIEIGTDPTPLATRGGPTGTRYVIGGTLVEATVGGHKYQPDQPIAVFGDDDGWATVIPGQRVSTRGRLGVDTFASWPTLSINARVAPNLIAAEPWWQHASGTLRGSFVSLTKPLAGDAAGLLPGLVLGDRSGISPALTQDSKITGLTHLLAVSGSHFAVLCGAVLVLLRRAGPRPAALGGLLFSMALVGVVRPSPSVLRAAVMGGLTLAALMVGRTRSILPALASAVMVLLLWNPALAVDAGFALSVQATAAIVLVAPRWSDALQRRGWPAGWANLLAVPTVAHLGTMPVIAALSGTVSVWAIPANILVGPAVPVCLILGVLAALCSVWWTTGASVLAHVVEPAANWIAFCAHWVAGWPAATLAWPTTTPGILALTGLVITVPLALRFPRLRAVAAAAVAGAAVVLIPTTVLTPGWPPPDWLTIGCEVGQGDGFVVSTGIRGQAVVIDTGPEPSVMDRCLTRLGVTDIPLLVLTHLHADHIDGLTGVLHNRTVSQIGVGPGREPPPAWGHLLDTADLSTVPVVALTLGARFNVGQLVITVLGPDRSRVSAALGPNDQSVVLMIAVGGFRLLFSGDVESSAQQALLNSGQALQADVLKLPHHGSAKLLPAFMAAVHPSIVLIGVGVGNDFGHPSEYALRLAKSVGVQLILRTDTDGDIAVNLVDGVLGTATRGAAPIQPRTARGLKRPRQRVRRRGSSPAPPGPQRAPGRVGPRAPAPADGARSTRSPPPGRPRGCRDP